MNHSQKLILFVMFLALCTLSQMLGHGIALFGLFIVPLVAILSTLAIKATIDEAFAVPHRRL